MPHLGEALATAHLDLGPLQISDVADMHPILAEPELYRFTGGEGPSLVELERRYARQTTGDPAGIERWLNWVMRRRTDGRAVGFVQATVSDGSAEIAWLVGLDFQRQGYATEAACALFEHLVACGVTSVSASIHPDHIASQRVASTVGLRATSQVRDGEILWT